MKPFRRKKITIRSKKQAALLTPVIPLARAKLKKNKEIHRIFNFETKKPREPIVHNAKPILHIKKPCTIQRI
jgi:hypothetical protein